MSRLWRDRLLISLAPGAVALARIAGGLRPRLAGRQVLDCDPAFGAEPWQGAVAAVGSAVEALRGTRMSATVVLSNHFARYAIVPFDAAVAGPEEELALARFHFSKVHGERANGWDIRLSEEPRGAPRLASAVDAGLIEAIRGRFPAGGNLRLVSVQPYLMSAFNLWRRHLARDSWLLLVEPRQACCALLGARKWLAVRAARGDFSTAGAWAALLDRELLRTEAAPAAHTALVHAPGSRKSVNEEAQGWKFLSLALPALEGFLPLEDTRFAMALTAR